MRNSGKVDVTVWKNPDSFIQFPSVLTQPVIEPTAIRFEGEILNHCTTQATYQTDP